MSEQEGVCPRCATPYEPGQDYCLECGLRLDSVPAEPQAPAAAGPPHRRSLTWIWAVLGALVVAAAGAAVAIGLSDAKTHPTLDDDDRGRGRSRRRRSPPPTPARCRRSRPPLSP